MFEFHLFNVQICPPIVGIYQLLSYLLLPLHVAGDSFGLERMFPVAYNKGVGIIVITLVIKFHMLKGADS